MTENKSTSVKNLSRSEEKIDLMQYLAELSKSSIEEKKDKTNNATDNNSKKVKNSKVKSKFSKS